jgi:type IV pilus assembly protein PilV
MKGVSLVESLVALVVLSVGMLGIAALYVEGLRSGRTALLRSQAVMLVTDMSDRIRANRAGGTSYAKGADQAGTENTDCETGGAGCDPAAMATHDIARWHQAVDGRLGAPTALPGGRGAITVDTTTTPTTYQIRVSWSETNQGAAAFYELRIQV